MRWEISQSLWSVFDKLSRQGRLMPLSRPESTFDVSQSTSCVSGSLTTPCQMGHPRIGRIWRLDAQILLIFQMEIFLEFCRPSQRNASKSSTSYPNVILQNWLWNSLLSRRCISWFHLCSMFSSPLDWCDVALSSIPSTEKTNSICSLPRSDASAVWSTTQGFHSRFVPKWFCFVRSGV